MTERREKNPGTGVVSYGGPQGKSREKTVLNQVQRKLPSPPFSADAARGGNRLGGGKKEYIHFL